MTKPSQLILVQPRVVYQGKVCCFIRARVPASLFSCPLVVYEGDLAQLPRPCPPDAQRLKFLHLETRNLRAAALIVTALAVF